MKAMILAAGLGTRLRPITEKFAKPAVPFLNIPLLYYPLFLMEQTGRVEGLVLNTHHLPEQIENLASRLPLPARQRSQKFATGCQELDTKNVGFECEAGKIGTSVFDASISGNSNAGHEIATDLSEDDRLAVIEYMKSI